MSANSTTIAFLGFGEAARAFRASLAATDPAFAFMAYDIKLRGSERDAMLAAMQEAGVEVAEDAGGLGAAGWIFSAVTADQSLVAVEPLIPALGRGHVVFDINSVSPGRKQETARRINATGAAYVDMAVMTPVLPRGHKTPVLLAGAPVADLRQAFDDLGFSYGVAGGEPGEATAIKMVRSLFVKGLEAITVETLLAAEASGCLDEILATLSSSYPGLGWPGIADYHFERTLTHGARRAAEMEECAVTLHDLGLHGDLAAAIAAVHRDQGKAGTGAEEASERLRLLRQVPHASRHLRPAES